MHDAKVAVGEKKEEETLRSSWKGRAGGIADRKRWRRGDEGWEGGSVVDREP